MIRWAYNYAAGDPVREMGAEARPRSPTGPLDRGLAKLAEIVPNISQVINPEFPHNVADDATPEKVARLIRA
jgi:hypothetical protein